VAAETYACDRSGVYEEAQRDSVMWYATSQEVAAEPATGKMAYKTASVLHESRKRPTPLRHRRHVLHSDIMKGAPSRIHARKRVSSSAAVATPSKQPNEALRLCQQR